MAMILKTLHGGFLCCVYLKTGSRTMKRHVYDISEVNSLVINIALCFFTICAPTLYQGGEKSDPGFEVVCVYTSITTNLGGQRKLNFCDSCSEKSTMFSFQSIFLCY